MSSDANIIPVFAVYKSAGGSNQYMVFAVLVKKRFVVFMNTEYNVSVIDKMTEFHILLEPVLAPPFVWYNILPLVPTMTDKLLSKTNTSLNKLILL
jgi:hypothetical protein